MPTRIAHVSDLHVGAVEGAALQTLTADLAAAQVDATVVTGDLTMRARAAEFTVARAALEGFPDPTMVVIGNHDIPLHNVARRLLEPYDGFLGAVTDELDPVLDLPGVRIQGLGSMPRWRWKSGRISDRQSDLVRTTFASAPAGTVRVVALHHPPSSQDLATIAGHDDFEAALIDAEVDVVLAGHTHVPAIRLLDVSQGERTRQIVEVVAGTATSHRTRGVARSWWLVELSATTLTVTEHVDEGTQWVTRPSQAYPLAADAH